MVRIVGYSDQYANDFRTLNEEWLERYFVVEPIDQKVLSNPRAHIIDPGGEVLFAIDDEAVLGTCALKAADDHKFELTKMAVTASAQGRGIGRLLMQAACDWFEQRDGTLLFLESHSALKPALHLYRQFGFEDRGRPFTSEYARSDVYMEWQGRAPADRR